MYLGLGLAKPALMLGAKIAEMMVMVRGDGFFMNYSPILGGDFLQRSYFMIF